MGEFKIEKDIYDEFFEFLKSKTGLNFKSTKLPLLENRLRKRIENLGINSLENYFFYVLKNQSELEKCLPLLTTHKTEWFREIIHFQWIQEHILKKQKNIRIWSAACSSGEEPFSLLFLAIKNRFEPKEVKILGTDISPVVLEKAIKMPNSDAFKKQLFFLEKKMNSQISNEQLLQYLKYSVDFKLHNLLNSNSVEVLPFDIVVIRNVFIYFDFETIDFVVANILRSLKRGGFLIIGLSETINYRKFDLTNLGNGIFRYGE